MIGRLKPVHLPYSVGPAHKVRSVTLRRAMTKNANKTKIGADIIHIEESDEEVQFVSHKQHGHKDNIGDHVIDVEQLPQQQHPVPLHSNTSSSLQQSRHTALHQLQLPICGEGAMITLDDNPSTTNLNASNVGFQDSRTYQHRTQLDLVQTSPKFF
jgi:hypothetical protein